MDVIRVVDGGLGALVRGTTPAWLLPAFVAVTHLGSVGFFLLVFTLYYWFGDHERGAHATSVLLGGIALAVALKSFFAVPRPPDEFHVVPATGFSFPSGHALGSTVAYGVLAYDWRIGTWRGRFAGAALIVGAVSASRVVLGVHFLQDVVAGVVFGIVFLAVVLRFTGHAPRPGFLLAAGLGVAAFAISGASQDGVAVMGTTLGALSAWWALDTVPSVDARRGQIVLVVGVLPAIGAVGYVSTLSITPLAAAFVLSAAVTAAILSAPLLVSRVSLP